MRKIYISGPMSGIADLNFPAFDKAREKFIAKGYWVVSPADLERKRSSRSYKEALRDDFKHLLECDTIYLLNGWKKSYGARVEFVIAKAIGLMVIKEEECSPKI